MLFLRLLFADADVDPPPSSWVSHHSHAHPSSPASTQLALLQSIISMWINTKKTKQPFSSHRVTDSVSSEEEIDKYNFFDNT